MCYSAAALRAEWMLSGYEFTVSVFYSDCGFTKMQG